MAEGRGERRRGRTRRSLLDSALALFARRGIYAPSIEEITEAADLGKGTFYMHFASREKLIAALVGECFAALRSACERACAGSPPAGLPSALLEAHGRFFHDHPDRLLLLHQARGWMKIPGDATQDIRREFEAYVAWLEGLLSPFLRLDRVPARRRRRSALVFAGFISGVLSFEYILGGGLDALPDLPHDGDLLCHLSRRPRKSSG